MDGAVETWGRYVDPALARGIVASESRALAAATHELDRAIERCVLPLRERVAEWRKLGDGAMRAFAAAAAALSGGTGTLGLEADHRLNHPIRSRNFVRASAVTVERRGTGSFRIVTRRVHVTAGLVSVGRRDTGLAFSPHVAERLLQRRGRAAGGALEEVAREIIGSAGLIAMCARSANALPRRRMAIPFGDGLVFGTVLRAPDRPREAWHYGRTANMPARPSCNCMTPEDAGRAFGQGRLVFTANTFVGDRSLTDSQRDVRDWLASFVRDRADELEVLSDRTLWPLHLGFPEGISSFDLSDEDMAAIQGAFSEVEGLLSSEWAYRAMGNYTGFPAPTRGMLRSTAEADAEHEARAAAERTAAPGR